jgi:hypothetical protein
LECLRSFAGLVRDELAAIGPVLEILTVGVPDRLVVGFVVVETCASCPTAAGSLSIDRAIGRQLDRPRVTPRPQILAGEMHDMPRMIPVLENPRELP